MEPDEAQLDPRLWSAIADHWLNNRMTPAQMKVACYCLRRNHIAPQFMAFAEWIALARQFEISETWLRQSLRDLWSLGMLMKDSRKKRCGYSLNPRWQAPPPQEPAP